LSERPITNFSIHILAIDVDVDVNGLAIGVGAGDGVLEDGDKPYVCGLAVMAADTNMILRFTGL
jgi:hypothetical protein